MILLSEKDADYVAALAREIINQSEDAYKHSIKKSKFIYEHAKELCSLVDKEEDLKGFYEVEKEYKNALVEIEKSFQEDLEKWTKVIELMYTGSKNG